MSRFRARVRRWWDEEDESDVDDLFIIAGLLEGSKRNKRKKKFRGSLPGRRKVPRDISGGHNRIYLDYFVDPCVYSERHFRRRFRMSRSLFLRIVDAVESHDDYFRQKLDAIRTLGASPIQKVVATVRMLAYGISADFLDEYVRMGESTITLPALLTGTRCSTDVSIQPDTNQPS
jgi:hypothetical protein